MKGSYPQSTETRFTRPQCPFNHDGTAQTPKECPLATPSACRARMAFDRVGHRAVLRSRHSALWAVAVASNDLQANRPPLLAPLCPCGAWSQSSFQKAPSPENQKRGSRCRRQWGTKSPEGVDPARRSRGQGERQAPRRRCLRPAPKAASGRSFFLPLLGFPPPEALKAFFKVKDARARYGFWKAYGYWPAWPLLQVK